MMGNDITKIKIFADTNLTRLEQTINEFMEDKFVYDIKYTPLVLHGGTTVTNRVMVLYEDRYKAENSEVDDSIMTVEEAIKKITKGEI